MSDYQTLEAAREIGSMPGGLALLRILQAHGVTNLECRDGGDLREGCSLERMIAEAKAVQPLTGRLHMTDAPVKITMSPVLESANVSFDRDGELCFLNLKAGPTSAHKTDVSLYIPDLKRAKAIVAALKDPRLTD